MQEDYFKLEPITLKPHNTRFKIRRIVVFSLLCISYALMMFVRTCPSIVAKDMAETYHVEKSRIGIFTSLYFYSYGFVQLFTGLLVDVIEPGFIVGGSLIVVAIGNFICGMSHSFLFACFGRVIVGLGAGPAYVSATRCAVDWFSLDIYATMLGIIQAIGNLGYILAETPLAYISDKFGWQWAINGLAAIAFLMAILDFFLVRGNPVTLGYEPVNSEVVVKKSNFKESFKILGKNVLSVSKAPRLWVCIVLDFLLNGPWFNISGNWGSQWLIDVIQCSKTSAGNVLMSFTIGTLISSLILPRFAEFIKQKKKVMIITVLMYSGVIGFGFMKSQTPMWLIYLLFILQSIPNANSSILYSMAVDCTDPNLAGAAIGLMNMILFFVSAAYQYSASVIIEKFGSVSPNDDQELTYTYEGYFWGLWFFSTVSSFLGFILSFFLPDIKDNYQKINNNFQSGQSFASDMN